MKCDSYNFLIPAIKLSNYLSFGSLGGGGGEEVVLLISIYIITSVIHIRLNQSLGRELL